MLRGVFVVMSAPPLRNMRYSSRALDVGHVRQEHQKLTVDRQVSGSLARADGLGLAQDKRLVVGRVEDAREGLPGLGGHDHALAVPRRQDSGSHSVTSPRSS